MRYILILMASALIGIVPSQAFAQFSSDSSADTVLYADNTVQSDGVVSLKGQADIRQGDVRLLADSVQIFTADGQGGGLSSTDGITRVVANGNFYYITPDQEVRGKKGVYTRETDTFVVTGDVVLLQEDSVVTGSRLNYNLTTGAAEVTGSCKGRRCGKDGRVAILIRSTNSAQGSN